MHISIRPKLTAAQGRVSTCLLVAAWVYANISSVKWLFETFRQASRLNLMLIGLMVVVLLVRMVRTRRGDGEVRLFVSAKPEMRSLPLVLMVGSAISAIAFQWLLDIEQFTVVLFLLGTYGLCGLYLTPSVWRNGLPLASLVACVLPFSSQVGTGMGMPARIFTAHAVEQVLSVWHIIAISSYDIIVLENGIAHVDAPCSGLKSLWTGTIFLLAATWLENRKLGARWLLICLFNLGFLLCANIVRVLILVVITHVLKQPQIAEILHIPLGLLGLCISCGLSWVLLQSVPKQKDWEEQLNVGRLKVESSNIQPSFPKGDTSCSPLLVTRPASLATQALLLVFVVGLGVMSQLYHPPEEQPLSIASLHWPTQIVSERIPLTEAEHKFFDNYPYLLPEKRRFSSDNLSGSILVVANTTWRTYHPPELCLLGTGLKVDGMERKQLTPVVYARWLSLGDGKLSATYWFQSPQKTTDDFLSRFWSDVTRRQKNWVLVSVLFDSFLSPDNAQVREFATTMHNAIAHSLEVEASKASQLEKLSSTKQPPALHRFTRMHG